MTRTCPSTTSPPWPTWDAPPAKGLDGADPVALATAAEAACPDAATSSGGFFDRLAPGGDLSLANTYYHARQRVLADPSMPLFVRGTGLDTVVLDGSGTPLGLGVLPWLTGCLDQNDPNAPFVLRKVGM